MEGIEFFEGKRNIQQLSIGLNKGKTKLECTIWEEWQMIKPSPFTLRCNNKRELSVTHKAGFEHTSTETFESNIGGTLGIKGVASLESSLKTTLHEEVKFQLGKEVTDSFSFSSPECGFLLVRLYKKTRTYYFKYVDTRLWHRKAFEFPLVEWLEPIYDGTVSEKYDSNCNCKEQQASDRIGTPCRVVFNIFSKLAVFWEDTKQLEFADNPHSLNPYFSVKDGIWQGEVPGSLLPDYLQFLTGVQPDKYLGAQVWQEPTFSPAILEVHPHNVVNIEFDEEYRPVEKIPVYATSESARGKSR
jgi:hypothetical protein